MSFYTFSAIEKTRITRGTWGRQINGYRCKMYNSTVEKRGLNLGCRQKALQPSSLIKYTPETTLVLYCALLWKERE